MKEKYITEGILTYKEVRKASPIPYVVAGVAFLLIGLFSSMYQFSDYLWAAIVSGISFCVARIIWKGKKIRIELPPDTGDAEMDQLMTEARELLLAFRKYDEQIEDPVISACIVGIESKCTQILSRLKEQPALFGQLRTFLRYYLPTTNKLLQARADIEKNGVTGENARLVSERTDRVLPEVERAFSKQLEALDKHRYLDIQVEMDVLEGMLKSDGLSDMK